MNVIEERRRAGESLMSDELLGVETAVRLAESDVALARDLAEGVIVWHQMLTELAQSILQKSGRGNGGKTLKLQDLSFPRSSLLTQRQAASLQQCANSLQRPWNSS
jgi:hypothetical protein